MALFDPTPAWWKKKSAANDPNQKEQTVNAYSSSNVPVSDSIREALANKEISWKMHMYNDLHDQQMKRRVERVADINPDKMKRIDEICAYLQEILTFDKDWSIQDFY